MIEYRICWNASSNVSFKGHTDWDEWAGFEETMEEVEDSLSGGTVDCHGLSEALEASGFEWWVETREAA